MPVANDQPMVGRIRLIAMAFDEGLNFPLDSRLQRLAGPVAKNVVQNQQGYQSDLLRVIVQEAVSFLPRVGRSGGQAIRLVNRYVRFTESTPHLFNRQ